MVYVFMVIISLLKGIKDASNENIINRSDYSQYSKLELILQCKSTSDNEFIAVGEPSVRANNI